ncbi:MAG: hypothetical protein Q8K62_03010 [Thiobacillus sp.]|nr:hypothetical protein [Thiobacillus sp.]
MSDSHTADNAALIRPTVGGNRIAWPSNCVGRIFMGMILSKCAAEGLVQQGLLQRVEGGEFLLVEEF